jgi:hypothetical protein
MLLPADTETYREMIPTAQIALRYRKNLVKYDDSIVKVDHRHAVSRNKRHVWHFGWQSFLRSAFECGPLSPQQITEIIGGNPIYPAVNVWRVQKLFKMSVVGSVWPGDAQRVIRLYMLEELCPGT